MAKIGPKTPHLASLAPVIYKINTSFTFLLKSCTQALGISYDDKILKIYIRKLHKISYNTLTDIVVNINFCIIKWWENVFCSKSYGSYLQKSQNVTLVN